jgi:DNA-binding response OmpR family regulator
MYALVITENRMVSELLCRNLNCENILSEYKSIHENYKESIVYNNYDCVIIKLTSSESENFKILKTINEIHHNTPLFLLINRNHINHLENIQLTTKYIYPYDIPTRYLANEIKKIINKNKKLNQDYILKVHDLILDINRREVERFGIKQFLRNKEFQLLEFLMRNTDTLLTRQIILENVWDRNAYFMTNTVDVHINCLRKKIDYNKNTQLIETVYCSGYIFHSLPYKITKQSLQYK